MNTERLTRMSAFVRALPPENFDLTSWAKRTTTNPGFFAALLGTKPSCGTTLCACGAAADAGIFPGFSFRFSIANVQKRGRTKVEESTLAWRRPGQRTLYNWEAVQALFDITTEQAAQLFHPDSYAIVEATPTIVADRIDALLATAAPTAEAKTEAPGRTTVAKSLASQL